MSGENGLLQSQHQAGNKKRAFNEGRRHFKKNKKQKTASTAKEGSNEEVLIADIRSLLERSSLGQGKEDDEPAPKPSQELPEPFTEITLTVSELSSTGDGLGLIPGSSQIAVVPFTAPGDVVVAKVIKHLHDTSYTLADFVKVVTPSGHRDESLVGCKYFSRCSGCQFQMLPYAFQLAHKKTIVEKAYRNFSGLPSSDIPTVGETMGSPLQYGYRTKLTPHFDGPPGGRRERRHGGRAFFEEVPPIGFMQKGTRKTMDIEDCPIGTNAVRKGLVKERQRVKDELEKYQRGATLLMRESTQRVSKSDVDQAESEGKDSETLEDRGDHVHRKTCITDQNATSTEYVDDYRFENPAGAFFQNNNSILPSFTQYIRDHILPRDMSPDAPKIVNLIDAYSGSGLFTVTLSPLFTNSVGIDVSASSIKFATRNAELNNLTPATAKFIAGDANNLFASVDFKPEETAVVIDPSRKGCDEGFLRQLLNFGPVSVCYVSCNVHTQARDVGLLVGGMEGVNGGQGMYEIESLRGFDFFPQTSHVEGVAILRKKRRVETQESPASEV